MFHDKYKLNQWQQKTMTIFLYQKHFLMILFQKNNYQVFVLLILLKLSFLVFPNNSYYKLQIYIYSYQQIIQLHPLLIQILVRFFFYFSQVKLYQNFLLKVAFNIFIEAKLKINFIRMKLSWLTEPMPLLMQKTWRHT